MADKNAPSSKDSGMLTQAKNEGWWNRPCGGREVLAIALPLVISTSFTSLMHFVDRLFLTWHSVEAMAASMQAGLAQWTLICFAIGVAMYVNSFVAQYDGAGQPQRIGVSVWQGIWFGILLTPLFLLAIPLAPWLFALAGHDETLQQQEVIYFQILAWSSGPTVVAAAMSTFFTGRGESWVAMVVTGLACAVNIFFDWLLIFDKLNLGVAGIAGAAWATVFAQWSTVLFYGIWMFQPKLREQFGLSTGWKLDLELMRRLIGYGGPSGLHMLIEASGFTLLLLSVGALGPIEAGATTLAFNINIVAFIPMVGLGIAVSTLVGQQLGQNRPELAERATWTGLSMGIAYSTVFAVLYFTVPHWFLVAHAAAATGEDFAAVHAVALVLLKFVAVYFLFDTVQIVFSFAIKGAGDTLYVLLVASATSIVGVTVGNLGLSTFGPLFGGGLYWWWFVLTCWIFQLAALYLVRFLQGRWRSMRVIEPEFVLPEREEEGLALELGSEAA